LPELERLHLHRHARIAQKQTPFFATLLVFLLFERVLFFFVS
jgi:hypothetical protein